MIHTCRECGWLDVRSKICPLFKRKMDKDNESCFLYSKEIIQCEICGKHMGSESAIVDSETAKLICDNCATETGTCKTCKHTECKLKNNDLGLPIYVMETIRQGNMVMQQQVINPELIEKTCKAGCKCWFNETCCKQEGCCMNYTYILEKEEEESGDQNS